MLSRFSFLLIIGCSILSASSFSFPISSPHTTAFVTRSSRTKNLVTTHRNESARTTTTSPSASNSHLGIFRGNSATQVSRLSARKEDEIQWDLFIKHQAKGKWRGTWTSYDYMGDIMDETTASVNLILDPESQTVQHTHDIVRGKVSSDCKTCFDSQDVKTIHVANYSPGNIGKYRCASVAMCAGPSLMKSGAMSTELVLTHGNGRLRVIYQHAPVWERGVEPGSCPPQALKLFRTMVSREVLNSDAPPSREREEQDPPQRGDPRFFRNVPPFQWHQKWGGSSWTWGPQSGDRGWSIEELDEADAWHGRPTGDTLDVWAMRLPGGILLQCPRIITSGRVGLCRLAWLPEDEGRNDDGEEYLSKPKLLRVEAGILALEPVIDEENDVMLGFYPPELASLRCDVLQKYGVLENVSMIEKLKSMGEMGQVGTGELDPLVEDNNNNNENNNNNVEEDVAADISVVGVGGDQQKLTMSETGPEDDTTANNNIDDSHGRQENDSDARDDNDVRAIRNALKL